MNSLSKEQVDKMVEFLKSLKEEVVIIGHDVIDCDSACSCILLNRVFNYLGIRNKIVIADEKIHEIDLELLRNENIDLNIYKGTIPKNKPIFLVDHYKSKHSDYIVGCIDHHPTSEKVDYPFYHNELSASTGRIIYNIMKIIGYPISKDDVRLVALSIMLDTSSLKSTKCPESQKIWTKELIKKYGLDYNEFYNLGLCLSKLDKPMKEVVTEGFKEYCFNNINVKSSYIQINKEVDVNPIIEFIKNSLDDTFPLWVFLVHDFSCDCTFEYRITKDNIVKIEHKQITSRGTTIMPLIEKNINTII